MRLLETQGLSGIWLTLVLFAVALVVSLPRTHTALAELVRSPGHAALLMLAAGWTNIAFVEAVLNGNILRVLLLFYLSPLWAVILGWLILRERPSRMAVVSLFIAMGGAFFMLWDARLGFPGPAACRTGMRCLPASPSRSRTSLPARRRTCRCRPRY